MTTLALSLLLKADGTYTVKSAIDGVKKSTDDLGNAVKRKSTADKEAAAAAKALETANRRGAAATGNLVANFNDLDVMMAAGQNPLQLALQQGTQITQVIGPMGAAGAAKALGSAFLGMLSPINLVTLAVIAGGAATVQWLSGAAEDAKTAADRVKELKDATEAYRTSAEASGASVDALADKYGSLAMVAAKALRNDADRKEAESMAALSAQVDVLANSFGDLYQKEVNIGGMVGTIVPAVQELKVQFNFTERAASQFLGLLRDLETAEGPKATADAARELRDWMEAAYGSVAKMPPEMAALYNDLNSSTIAAAELQGTLDLVEGTARRVDAAAALINRTIASADGSKLALAFSASFPVASQLLGIAQSINAELGAAQKLAAAQMGLAADGKVYSGRGGDPRTSNSQGYGEFVYTGPALDAYNNPIIPGSGGGGGAARAEADSIKALIASLEAEVEALHVQNPVQKELLEHRKALEGATEAERAKVEELIAAREREKAAIEAMAEMEQLGADLVDQGLDALILKSESLQDALQGVIQMLIKAALQAALLGSGPLGSLFGGTSIGSLIFGAKATGGMVHGPGDGTSDSIPTMLSNGEYVVNARATARNRHLLEAINSGGLQGFASGGMVGSAGDIGGGFGARGPATIVIDMRGARGNREIEDIAFTAVRKGLEVYDREMLPQSVKKVSSDSRRLNF